MEAIDNIHSPSDSQTTVSLEQASNELRSVQKVVLQEESSLPIATPVSDQPAAPGTPEPVAYVGAVAKSPLKQTAQLMQQAAPILSALNVPVLPQTTPGEICQNTIKLNLDQPVDSLPVGARLFMGNLATERTSPMEVASMFVKYGNILEVSLKGSYGFVQFDNPTSCLMAIQCENKRTVCDLKIGSAQIAKDKKKGDKTLPGNQNQSHNQQRPKPYDRPAARPSAKSRSPRRSERRRRVEILIIVIGRVDDSFVDMVESRLGRPFETDVLYLNPRQNLNHVVQDCREDGMFGVVFLEVSRQQQQLVALQVFYKDQTFEFDNLSLEDACRYIKNPKPAPAPLSGIPGIAANQSQAQLASAIANLIAVNQAQGRQVDPQALLALAGSPMFTGAPAPSYQPQPASLAFQPTQMQQQAGYSKQPSSAGYAPSQQFASHQSQYPSTYPSTPQFPNQLAFNAATTPVLSTPNVAEMLQQLTANKRFELPKK